MKRSAGYVLNVAEDRREELLEDEAEQRLVAESVPAFAHPRNYPLLCFASFSDDALTHIAMASKGRRGASRRWRLNLQLLMELEKPIPKADILAVVPASVRQHVADRFDRGGLLPDASFRAVVEALRELSPSSRSYLNRFSAARRARIAALPRSIQRALGYQREAVATALALAEIDRGQLQTWDAPSDVERVTSYLDGLPQVRLRESQMIANDSIQVPGFEFVRALHHSSAVFENGATRLTITIADKLPLEQQLGADLIYMNETYQSFVLVQYKALEEPSGSFRLPNEQLDEEISRMDATWSELTKAEADDLSKSFRLNENPFFLKLCKRIVFDPDDQGLANGMYLPLSFWKLLAKDPSTIGSRGGRAINKENAGRHLDNTLFIALVTGGWIGTTVNQTRALTEAIRQVIQDGKALIFAVKSDITQTVQASDRDLIPTPLT